MLSWMPLGLTVFAAAINEGMQPTRRQKQRQAAEA